LGQRGLAQIQVVADQLEGALARLDNAFRRHDDQRYTAAAAMAEHARCALASVPALTVAELMAKAKAVGPVPAITLGSLSEGELVLVASIIRDVRRMAEFRADADESE
jgi:hypothetical protein